MGYEAGVWSGSWLLSYVIAFICCAIVGVAMQVLIFRRMEGQDLRQTLVTLGISIVAADLMVWVWGGNAIQIDTPNYLAGPIPTPIIVAVRSSGEAIFLRYPLVRLVIFGAAVLIGIGMWLALYRTRIGVMIRAGVDDRDMLSVLGYRVQLVFVLVFAFGAGLAGMAGIVGGTFQSLSLGEDTHYLLASLQVVIVGGMGSIPGAALGALIIGLSEQFGLAYFQHYAIVSTFLIMVIVLALRPQGLLGRS
jgi:branched-chain amino acid transport system permease protein